MSEEDLPKRLHAYRANDREQQGIAWWDEPHFEKTHITIVRVALSHADVHDPALPSFPLDTKRGDPRHGWYRGAGYGTHCWELDALSPVILRERVEPAIVARLDLSVWMRYVAAEQVERESITATVSAWRAQPMEPAR